MFQCNGLWIVYITLLTVTFMKYLEATWILCSISDLELFVYFCWICTSKFSFHVLIFFFLIYENPCSFTKLFIWFS